MSEEKDINNIKKGKEAYSKGKAYEDFIENFYKRIKGIFHKIEKRKIIDGKTTRCEFDLYWEEEKEYEGIAKVAIECKFLSKEVPVKEMRDFVGKIKDCGINKGIFITTKGFQKGCIEIAEKENIETFIIRKPVEKDWEGLIKGLEGKIMLIQRGCKIKKTSAKLKESAILFFNKENNEGINLSYLINKKVLDDSKNKKVNESSKRYKIEINFSNYYSKIENWMEKIMVEYEIEDIINEVDVINIDFSEDVLAFFKNLRKENDNGKLIMDPYSFKS